MSRIASCVLAALLCFTYAEGHDQPVVTEPAPVLWRDPGAIGDKDLRWGNGSADRQPVPPFTFIKEDLSGSKPKVRVTDSNGVTWNVKFGGPEREKNEVHPELAATRIAAALGYFTEEDYYVAHGRIDGVRDLPRADSARGRLRGRLRRHAGVSNTSRASRSSRAWPTAR